MGVYINNNGTLTPIANETQFIAPVNEYVTKSELEAIVPSDTSADNKLVNGDDVADYFEEHKSELTGNGIASIEKTATSGLVDTYTITYTDGSTSTYEVTNGRGADEVWKAQGYLGAKNLIPFPYYNMGTVTRTGLTWVAHDDGTVSVDGIFEGSVTYSYLDITRDALNNGVKLEAGKYKVSCGASYAESHIEVRAIFYNGRRYSSLASARGTTVSSFTITQELVDAVERGESAIFVLVQINNTAYGTEIHDTLYPMIRFYDDTDGTYKKPIKTNAQLQAAEETFEKDVWGSLGYMGVKNLCTYPYYKTQNVPSQDGITITADEKGVITFNGTSIKYSSIDIHGLGEAMTQRVILPKGKYVFTDGVVNEPQSSIGLIAQIRDVATQGSIVQLGNSRDLHRFEFEITDEMAENLANGTWLLLMRSFCENNRTIDNIKMYPMIRRIEDTDNTWHPYAPTNYELMQSDNALAEGLAKFGKKLWSGNFTSGSIQVTGAAKYTVFIMLLGSFNTVAIGNSGNGGGVVYAQKPNQEFTFGYVAYRLSSAVSGDDIIFTIDATHQGGMRDGVTYGGAADVHMPITAIYGLF